LSGIPSNCDEKIISAFLSDRNINPVNIRLSKSKVDSTNVAFVTFAGSKDADIAALALDNKMIDNGRTITAERNDLEDLGMMIKNIYISNNFSLFSSQSTSSFTYFYYPK
jgi:RNA recognition motif-containing protein